MSGFRLIASVSIISSLAGCALQPEINPNKADPTASGSGGEYIVDNSDVAYFEIGDWKKSTYSNQFYGDDYSYASAGSGESVATWNLNFIKTFNIYARWASHSNRGTNVKYTIYYLDELNHLVEDVVTVDQTHNGGAWFKLGTYRMSTLTGRVTVSDDANGYVVADSVLFEEVSQKNSDQDGDGMDDRWELDHGLDPANAEDASLDLDNDGLTNLDEFLLLTDPTSKDSDGDGMDDAFEVAYGLDPVKNDSHDDADGDGFSNIEEYQALTDPFDPESLPASNTAALSWTAPNKRENGGSLALSEIAGYELVFHREIPAKNLIIDNDTSGFTRLGRGLSESTYDSGYIGDNYLTIARGGGETAAEWSFSDLIPGITYQIDTNWASAPNRASNVVYQLRYVDSSDTWVNEEVTVNQQKNGGEWQGLSKIIPGDSTLTVTMTNEANGYVIADAVRALPQVDDARQVVSLDDPTLTSYVVKNLSPGTWVFQIRVIDTDGIKSVLSKPLTKTLE